jgi:DNA-binding IclR family transcriptional regulator
MDLSQRPPVRKLKAAAAEMDTADAAGEGVAAREQRGIQSVEVGGQLLRALAHHGRPMALKDLAREAGMVGAKAHPYLVSFGKIGLIEQDKVSGRYGLGPLALQLGLMGLHQADPVRIAAPLLPGLAQLTGQTVALAVWGNRGPTIVMVEESPQVLHVNMNHGTVFSIGDTASGRLYGAYLPRQVVQPLYEQERRAAARGARLSWRAFAASLDEVRAQGLSRTAGTVVAGVDAMSAPVFDHRGQIVLAVTAIGTAPAFDSRWDGPVAQALRQTVATVSARLGWRPPA